MMLPRTKRKRVALVAILLILLGCWYLFFYDPPYRGLVQLSSRPAIFAHRGFGNHAPDNSLAGALIAMEKGMDGVDMDGQISADGIPLIFHDLSIDRLTEGTGRVSEKPIAVLLTLDLGPTFGPGFEGTMVTTFEDFVQRIAHRGILMVELKVPGLGKTGIEEKVVAIIQKYGAEDSVYLSSFNPLVLYRLKKIDPNIRTVLIMMDTNWNAELLAEIRPEDLVNLPWPLRQEFLRRAIRKIIHPDLLSVNYKVDERTIDTLLRKGYPIFLWTPDEEEDLRWVLEKNPYGVISDEPERARALRDSLFPAP